MSWRTPCCFCEVQRIRERARKRGARVVIRKRPLGRTMPKGVDVFLVPAGKRLPRNPPVGPSGARLYWVLWCGELSRGCAC